MDGQQRHIRQQGLLNDRSLRTSRVLVIGAGGLGSPLLYYLAAARVGSIVVCDGDRVSLSDLNRQILYAAGDVGRSKAEAAVERLRALDGNLTLRAEPVYFTEETASGLLENCSLVALAVDRLEVRRLGKPPVCGTGYPSYRRWGLPLERLYRGRDSREDPCLECWLGACRQEEPCQNVAGPAAGLLGAAEAMLALRILSGDRQPPAG